MQDLNPVMSSPSLLCPFLCFLKLSNDMIIWIPFSTSCMSSVNIMLTFSFGNIVLKLICESSNLLMKFFG